MVIIGEQISSEEHNIAKILISIICLYGNDGLPLDEVEREFQSYCGFSIPWKSFGAESLRSWLITLPHIYIVYNQFRKEVLIEQSPKSLHVKNLIEKQKRSHSRPVFAEKRKAYETEYNNHQRNGNGYNSAYNQSHKIKKRMESENLPHDSLLHTSINNNGSETYLDRYEKFKQLESMLPLFYKHQALGDDFFVDIADTKMGYYVPNNGPKQSGLCVTGQTIAALTTRIKKAVNLAPRVVVMIGFQDLIEGQSISTMVTDLRQLVLELKKKNTRVTLVTLIPSPKLPNVPRFKIRMDIFNRAILDYVSDPLLNCNVIDMNNIFMKETMKFKRDVDRFRKVAKNDPYKVFSDYGRKIFLNALKSCLKEQIEYGL